MPMLASAVWLLCAQDTVQEMAKNMKTNKTGATQASASELYDFMKRVSSHGHPCRAVMVSDMSMVKASAGWYK